MERHVLDRAYVSRHVLARRAVAARGCAHERSVLVGERDAAAVDLQLAYQLGKASERLFHAVHPRFELVEVHGVVDGVHAPLVLHGRKLIAHRPADALRGRIGVGELWMLRLELAQLAHERVEGAVRDLGRVLHVVQVRMVLDFLAQRLDALADIVVEQAQRIGHGVLLTKKGGEIAAALL